MTKSSTQRPLSRRIPAAVIDLALVALPTAGAVAVLHERFLFLPRAGGVQFSNTDQERINRIDQGFSRAVETDDSLYILSGSGWWLSLGLLVAMTIAVYVAVPALFRLRTPGQLVMKLGPIVQDEPEFVATLDLTGLPPKPAVDDAVDDAVEGAGTGTVDDAHADEEAETAAADPTVVSESTRSEERTQQEKTDEQQKADTPSVDRASVEAGGSQPIDADDVDITDEQTLGPITLADEADYVRWDRTNAADTDLRGTTQSPIPASFSQLALPESSLSDEPLTAATLVKTRESDAEAATKNRRLSDRAIPVWNENWQSWLYWDEKRERWLRHDTDAGRWTPLT